MQKNTDGDSFETSAPLTPAERQALNRRIPPTWFNQGDQARARWMTERRAQQHQHGMSVDESLRANAIGQLQAARIVEDEIARQRALRACREARQRDRWNQFCAVAFPVAVVALVFGAGLAVGMFIK